MVEQEFKFGSFWIQSKYSSAEKERGSFTQSTEFMEICSMMGCDLDHDHLTRMISKLREKENIEKHILKYIHVLYLQHCRHLVYV